MAPDPAKEADYNGLQSQGEIQDAMSRIIIIQYICIARNQNGLPEAHVISNLPVRGRNIQELSKDAELKKYPNPSTRVRTQAPIMTYTNRIHQPHSTVK